MQDYKFGERSLEEMVGVRPRLIWTIKFALEICQVDFGVYDGKRTQGEQAEFVRTGVSKTLKSKHLTGEAVDLVPYINGQYRWEVRPMCLIARAMQISADKHDVNILWGGVWDRALRGLEQAPEDEIAAYVERQKAKGHRVFVDGAHYELST